MSLLSKLCFVVFSILLLNGCAGRSQPTITDISKNYFQVYAKRSDFEHFMSFYSEKAQLNDIIYGHYAKNKLEIANFLNWDRGQFMLERGNNILTVTGQVTEQHTVITRGYFHPFNYNGKAMGPWLFVIILQFDADNKIIKQTDWINYTPRKDFLGGPDMNQQLLDIEQ